MGTQPSLPKKGVKPQIFGTFIVAKRIDGSRWHLAWIKMALGMEVGLSPGDFLLHGDPAPLPKRGSSPLPNF